MPAEKYYDFLGEDSYTKMLISLFSLNCSSTFSRLLFIPLKTKHVSISIGELEVLLTNLIKDNKMNARVYLQ